VVKARGVLPHKTTIHPEVGLKPGLNCQHIYELVHWHGVGSSVCFSVFFVQEQAQVVFEQADCSYVTYSCVMYTAVTVSSE